ncbi:MAG: hypothetical protein Q4D27_07705 [Coriobacteriia bacterium]|nr:hypothetical protein [Coriobacteriia bacterium]
MKMLKIASLAVAFAFAAMLAGCAADASSSLAQYTLDEASGVKIEAENAQSDNVCTTEDAITVKENDVIVISPFTETGSFHLTITPSKGGTAIFDDDVEGKVLFTIGADPGDYDVETSGNGVTGWMTVAAQNSEELMAQDEALQEALDKNAVETEAPKAK